MEGNDVGTVRYAVVVVVVVIVVVAAAAAALAAAAVVGVHPWWGWTFVVESA